jgi:hypothetical protein
MNMTTQEQAYINGFVKRASEYGVDQHTAIELLKSAGLLSELVGQYNPINHLGTIPAVALAALTKTRTDEEQHKADKHGLRNLVIPGVSSYNILKRIGHQRRKTKEREEQEKGQAKLKKHAGSFPIRPAKVRKGLKQPVNLGNAGTINETGLHVPHDQGRYLDSILHMKPSPKVESHLANLHNQFDIDDIVDSLSH